MTLQDIADHISAKFEGCTGELVIVIQRAEEKGVEHAVPSGGLIAFGPHIDIQSVALGILTGKKIEIVDGEYRIPMSKHVILNNPQVILPVEGSFVFENIIHCVGMMSDILGPISVKITKMCEVVVGNEEVISMFRKLDLSDIGIADNDEALWMLAQVVEASDILKKHMPEEMNTHINELYESAVKRLKRAILTWLIVQIDGIDKQEESYCIDEIKNAAREVHKYNNDVSMSDLINDIIDTESLCEILQGI